MCPTVLVKGLLPNCSVMAVACAAGSGHASSCSGHTNHGCHHCLPWAWGGPPPTSQMARLTWSSSGWISSVWDGCDVAAAMSHWYVYSYVSSASSSVMPSEAKKWARLSVVKLSTDLGKGVHDRPCSTVNRRCQIAL